MKKWVIIFLFIAKILPALSQQKNWQNLDLKDDLMFGMSTEKAYKILLGNKKASPVIVAIIDSGIDTAQEDLQHVLWTNAADACHGRNYLGFETGKEDITNLASAKKNLYDSLAYTVVSEVYKAGYQAHRKTIKEYDSHVEGMLSFISKLTAASNAFQVILSKIGKANPDAADFQSFSSQNELEVYVAKLIAKKLPHYASLDDLKKHELDDLLSLAQYHVNHGLSMEEVNISVEINRENNINDIENDALGLVPDENFTPYHGTHVAGIIAAKRNNGIGIDGIADHVQIMMLKVVNNIRELRDEDLANAINFAVDHGAKIINLSFGKPYTWNKTAVDVAVQYAMLKDVLIIHAAGNAGNNLDIQEHYPNPLYSNGKGYAKAWIEVGASGWKDDSTLLPPFSNYGGTSVDVFAPGVQIYSTLPFNQYASFDGTSMAAPMVAGLAALIREYYPYLNASQVKDIIIRSAVKVDHNVRVSTENGQFKLVPFSGICISGGIVNAYNAIKLAAEYK